MSQVTMGQGNVNDAHRSSGVDRLVIASCLPVLVIVGAVLIIAGGFQAAFVVPAIVVGLMVGMLTFVSMRDRGRPETR